MALLTLPQVSSKQFNAALPLIGGVIFLFVASQIHISFQPMPITFQSLAVMFIGLTYKPKQALSTIMFWHGLAACGAPVHAGLTGGLIKFMEPAAGYLFGFAAGAYVMAILKEKFSLDTWIGDVCLAALGLIVLYIFGVLWHGYFTGDITSALSRGVFDTMLPDVLKAVILCTGMQVMRFAKSE